MRTDELIGLLAQGAGAAPRGVVGRRLGAAMLLGLLAGVAIAFAWLGFIPAERYAFAAPWFKLAYAAAMALAAASARLASGAAGRAHRAGVRGDGAGAGGRRGGGRGPGWPRHKSCARRGCSATRGGIALVRADDLAARAGGAAVGDARPRADARARRRLRGRPARRGDRRARLCARLHRDGDELRRRHGYTIGILMVGALGALLEPRVLRW